MAESFEAIVADVRSRTRSDGIGWRVRGPAGERAQIGIGEPAFEVVIRNDEGLAAVGSFSELAIAEAHMRCDIDFDGDFLKVMELRQLVSNRNWLLAGWAHLAPGHRAAAAQPEVDRQALRHEKRPGPVPRH